jgi:hypothetical protein
VRLERTRLLTNLLLFHGLLAAPLAWTAQLVVGYGIGEADCSAGGSRWGIHAGTWELVVTAAAAAVALTGLVTAVWMLVEQRRASGDARGRIDFMAAGGILVSSVFIALILLGGIGSLYIARCHQS